MPIEKAYDLPFPPADVYAAWVSSKTVIPPASRMEVDPVVGGLYQLFVDTPNGVMRCVGKFLEIDPQKHLRYSWEWNGDGDVSLIDVTFEATPTGTRIALLHDGFNKPESEVNHDNGWDNYIDGFTAHLSRR